MTEAAKEDLTRTAARWFMGARGGLEVTRADMQNARCLLGDLLSAVADDLDAQADDDDCNCQTTTDWTVCDCIASLTARGVRDAAERVRGLLGKDTTDDCPDDLMARLRESFGLLARKDKTNE